MADFRDELREAINRHSQENGSNTPDIILADYLSACLLAFDAAVNAREKWYSRKPGWRAPLTYRGPLSWQPPTAEQLANTTVSEELKNL